MSYHPDNQPPFILSPETLVDEAPTVEIPIYDEAAALPTEAGVAPTTNEELSRLGRIVDGVRNMADWVQEAYRSPAGQVVRYVGATALREVAIDSGVASAGKDGRLQVNPDRAVEVAGEVLANPHHTLKKLGEAVLRVSGQTAVNKFANRQR